MFQQYQFNNYVFMLRITGWQSKNISIKSLGLLGQPVDFV